MGGYSTIDNEKVEVNADPPEALWVTTREDRTPRVRLRANPHYWDVGRGPYLQEVVFRNDLTPPQALDLVCTTDGEVDILTEVPAAGAGRVQASAHAKLVTIDAVRIIAGVINRGAAGLPFADRRARRALNLAVDRASLCADALYGHADPLAGLAPPSTASRWHRLSPHAHDPRQAAELWRAAGGAARPIRVQAPDGPEAACAERVAADLRSALGVAVEVTVVRGPAALAARRGLSDKSTHNEWDVFIQAQGAQAADAPPHELHRAFVGATGEYRAGPVVPEFETLYESMQREIVPAKQLPFADAMEKFVKDEALVLSLCAPHALYAVNRHVAFTPYRTTFELAECRVGRGHWSRRKA